MGERILKFHPGGYYHVFNRGANRQEIFRSMENYLYLIDIARRFAEKGIQIIVYCLMPNHYHFLLRQENNYSISRFIQEVFNIYSKTFNRMYHRKGTLFEGPFRAKEVLEEKHLLHLCRYIHRNPLESGFVTDLKDWPYSNYIEWINGKLPRTLEVRGSFNDPEEYRKFVFEYDPIKEKEKGLQNLLLDAVR